MKKITILLVLLCATLSIGSAQVQKRVTISSVKSVGMNADPILANPLLNSHLIRSSRVPDAPILPSYLVVAEATRKVFAAPQDDSGWIISNAVPGQPFVWGAGINSVPYAIAYDKQVADNQVIGFAQFFPIDPVERAGRYTIDTIMLEPFQFPNGGSVKPPVKQSVLLFGYAVKANLQTANGWNFSLEDPLLRQLGGSELEIPAETINSRTVINSENRLENILPTFVEVPNWTVEPDETFGFVLYMQNQQDSLEMFGTYMSDELERDSTKTLGYFVRRDPSSKEFLTKLSSYSFNNTAEFAQAYPKIAGRRIKSNFFCRVGGTLEGSGAVETLSDDAKTFALEPVTPNPVVGATKIQFSLQQPSQVSLRVTNSLGQVVKELASGAMNTGTYSADFDANDLPTGMYYYTLVAGTQSLTRSMVVVK